ncbi:UNVERIFIED_CONTAM: hypothetical protein RMT77_003527 [Armadillidium vulgare]
MIGPIKIGIITVTFHFLITGIFTVRARGPRWWKLSHTVDATTFLSNEILSNSLSDHNLPEAVQTLLRKKQRRLVRENQGAVLAVAQGIRNALHECQYQFKNRRWNCSVSNGENERKLYGKIVSLPCRETAFIYALNSAAIMHAVTRACTEGSIQTCSCDYKSKQLPAGLTQIPGDANLRYLPQLGNEIHNRASIESWEWGGCSEDAEFGYKFSKSFVDAGERGRDLRSVMNLHNNEAGRRHVKSSMRLKCKCHGMSGSCTVKSCWWRLSSFRRIGTTLKGHFDGASEVVGTKEIFSRQNDRRRSTRRNRKSRRRKKVKTAFLPSNAELKFPSKRDLIYYKPSPNFCIKDKRLGISGTTGRTCNVTSKGLDGCELMCCGRGYTTQVKGIQERCSCTFHWCCDVRCKICYTQKTIHSCR